jgi:hypothetical protein
MHSAVAMVNETFTIAAPGATGHNGFGDSTGRKQDPGL